MEAGGKSGVGNWVDEVDGSPDWVDGSVGGLVSSSVGAGGGGLGLVGVGEGGMGSGEGSSVGEGWGAIVLSGSTLISGWLSGTGLGAGAAGLGGVADRVAGRVG